MKLDLEPITVTRQAAGSYVDGRWVPGSESTFDDAAGNIQPLNGRELQQLSEGDRKRETKKIYTAFALQDEDIVTRADGVRYQVQNVENWSGFSLPHYKARLMRVEGQ